ncbi:hypothetical protein E2C01_088636 [Portunus trituberculatus]|uniref:Secreted protein n=1 Tax=Portunus trituberculatus TaxID=210409 RepID=A0A5B7JH32_PORTR|nr:hypothetical protein [Portunus trituberculatus]
MAVVVMVVVVVVVVVNKSGGAETGRHRERQGEERFYSSSLILAIYTLRRFPTPKLARSPTTLATQTAQSLHSLLTAM